MGSLKSQLAKHQLLHKRSKMVKFTENISENIANIIDMKVEKTLKGSIDQQILKRIKN